MKAIVELGYYFRRQRNRYLPKFYASNKCG